MARPKTYLHDTHPLLKAEWDSRANAKSFESYGTHSHEKAWWICPLGHSYQAMIANRVKGQGCSFCSGKKVLAGFNDLASQNPGLAAEWDGEANSTDASEIHSGSHQKVHWRCHLGHSWMASVANRNSIHNQNGCPVCSGAVLLPGFNDLLTLHPALGEKWDYERNSEDPSTLSPAHGKQITWTCSLCGGHWRRRGELEARRKTTRCSSCLRGTSLFEQEVATVVESSFPDDEIILNSRNVIAPYELDVVILSKGRAVELNGEYWHGDHNLRKRGFESAEAYHRMKVERCREAGFDLAFLWEDDWRDNPQAMAAALKNFVETGEKHERLQRLQSQRNYAPVSPLLATAEASMKAWAQRLEVSLTKEYSAFGPVWVMNGRVALGLHPAAPSSEALRQLQKEYAARSLTLFFAYGWDNVELLLVHLESKLGLANRSFAAKRLQLRQLSSSEADSFVEQYHVQGAARGSDKVSLGLFTGAGELLAVQQYAKYRFSSARGSRQSENSTWEGLRLCFKPGVQIHGGATRLQKFFENAYEPALMVSYVDLSHSLGDFKLKQGFVKDSSGGESYRWVLAGEPKLVRLKDRHGEWRENDLSRAMNRPVINPNQVAGAFGKGVGRLFYGGPLGSRQQLAAFGENDLLTHNDAIMEAIGYRKTYTAGQSRWRRFLPENNST